MAAAHDTHGLFARRDEYGWQTDARELRAFFQEYEADVGFKSTFSAMLAAHAGVALGSGPPSGWDPYAERIDRITRGTRVYRTLKAMDAAGHGYDVDVLSRLYGPRNGAAERPEFGELAPLAVYTDAVSIARDDLVFRESSRREERSGAAVLGLAETTKAELERDFWATASRIVAAERRIAWHRARLERIEADVDPDKDLVRAQSRAAIARLPHIVDGWHELQRRILDAYVYDGSLRARLGAITSTDRELTAEDAIRSKLDTPKRITGDREAHATWRTARSVFVVEVTQQAEAMRRAAHAAYRKAKEQAS